MKKITLFTVLFGFIFGMNAQLDFYNLADATISSYPQVSGSATVLYDASTGNDYDDQITTNVPIGFDFYYKGTMHNLCTVSVNGVIGFTNSISRNNDLAATSADKTNLIAPLWDDLKLYHDNNGFIKYETTGTAPNRVFTVSWYNISKFYDSSHDMSFLVKLYEGSNNIEFYYGHIDSGSTLSNASIGMNANDGTTTTFISVTPGSPATYSRASANNSIDAAAFPSFKKYTFTFGHAYNDWNNHALPITLAAPRDATHPTYYVNNVGATNSHGNEPTCANFQGGDVWFKFVAPSTGAVNIIRTNLGDIGALGYALYHTSYASSVQYCNSITASHIGERNLIKDLVAGDTYYLRMWDYGNDNFGITKFYLEIIEVNDEAANAKDILVQPEDSNMFVLTFADNTYTTGSEAINGSPTCGNYQGGDLWYKFTATSSGEIKVVHSDTAGDWSSLAFAVYDSPTANTSHYCNYIYLGGTPPFATRLVTGLTAGHDYWLRVWDWGDNDLGNSGAFYLTDNTVGIEDYESLSFKFYPNPTTDILNVTADKNIDMITLTNLLGQEVRRLQPNQNEISINVADLQKGVYLMNVKVGDKVSTVKVIKQ